MAKQLIILGNGFDLTSNLKTTYDDFFKYLINKMGPIDFSQYYDSYNFQSTIYYITKNNENFEDEFDFWTGWFFLMENSNNNIDLKWNDVEEQIKSVLKYISDKYIIKKYNDIPTNISLSRKLTMSEVGKMGLNDFVEYYFEDWLSYLMIKKTEQSGIPNVSSKEELKIYNLLLKDLNKFEEKFSIYLCEEVMNDKIPDFISEQPNELQKRQDLLLKILKDEYTYTYLNAKILNFNYTPLVALENDDQAKKIHKITIHIHGSLQVNEDEKYIPAPIIFGIDDTKMMYSDDQLIENKLYRFGKTYRIMNSDNEIGLLLGDEIETIKFYGHSLNQADYAYFQSIFDKVELYSSKIKLIFYFGDFENRNGNKAIFMDRIYKLIEDYGKNTFKNGSEIRGKNLLHKLLIEGRIRTKYLKLD